MEVKFVGSQSRSEFASPFAYWPSDLRLSGSQAHRSRWVGPVGRSGSPTWFAISGLHRGGTRQDRSIR